MGRWCKQNDQQICTQPTSNGDLSTHKRLEVTVENRESVSPAF